MRRRSPAVFSCLFLYALKPARQTFETCHELWRRRQHGPDFYIDRHWRVFLMSEASASRWAGDTAERGSISWRAGPVGWQNQACVSYRPCEDVRQDHQWLLNFGPHWFYQQKLKADQWMPVIYTWLQHRGVRMYSYFIAISCDFTSQFWFIYCKYQLSFSQKYSGESMSVIV